MVVPSKRPGGVVIPGGRSMVMPRESSPHKDLTILAKSGSGIHLGVTGLPSGVFTHWVKIFGAPVLLLETVAIEGTMSFECPMPLVGPMPLVLPLWFLLLLHSWGGKGSIISMDLKEVTHTQFECSTESNTWASVKVVNGSIHSLNSWTHSANWCDSSDGVGLARSAQCCRTLAYGRFLGVVSNDSPVSWTSYPSLGGRHCGPCSMGQVALCNH